MSLLNTLLLASLGTVVATADTLRQTGGQGVPGPDAQPTLPSVQGTMSATWMESEVRRQSNPLRPSERLPLYEWLDFLEQMGWWDEDVDTDEVWDRIESWDQEASPEEE